MILTDKVAHATDVAGVSCVLMLPEQRPTVPPAKVRENAFSKYIYLFGL